MRKCNDSDMIDMFRASTEPIFVYDLHCRRYQAFG